MQDLDWRLDCLFEPMEGLGAFQDMTRALEKPGVCSAYGPDDAQRAHLLAALARRTKRPLLVIVPNDMAAARMVEDLSVLLNGAARHLPARDVNFLKTAASSRELSMRRIEALGDALTGRVKALVVAADAMMFRLAPPEQFADRVINLDEGLYMEPAELAEKLSAAGYERVHLVEARGQFAVRGGILDVYPIGSPNALRVEFFDDEIDSIRSFDVMTQRSISRRPVVQLYPAQELLPDAAARERAAQALEALLEAEGPHRDAPDRQNSIEQEFDLIPFAEFLRLKDEADGDEGAKPKKRGVGRTMQMPQKVTVGSALKRNFGGVAEALRTGRTPDAADALLPVLLGYDATPADYLASPIVVFDQPDRLRERCENRFLEFKEHFVVALERQEALPVQADMLVGYDELLVRLEKHSRLLTNLFLRTEADFKPTALIKFECRNATAYQSNIRELAKDLDRWKAEGWRVALLAGGTARGERLEHALETQGSPAPFTAEIPEKLEPGRPVILPTTLNRGFLYPELRFAVVAESDIYGINRQNSEGKG